MTREAFGAMLALANALFNGAAAVLLVVGYFAIRHQRRDLHWKSMLTAFVVSSLFLTSYLVRFALTGAHRYPGHGFWRAAYLVILASHVLLAIFVPPLALRTFYLAYKRRFLEHKRIVRFTLPIWLYVSVTGVVVYLLLYHPPG